MVHVYIIPINGVLMTVSLSWDHGRRHADMQLMTGGGESEGSHECPADTCTSGLEDMPVEQSIYGIYTL